MKSEDAADARRHFGDDVTQALVLGGIAYLTLDTVPSGVHALEKSARSVGIGLEPDRCRKEEPGPWIDHLDEFPDKPTRALPGRAIGSIFRD